jgi:hypothetical protein
MLLRSPEIDAALAQASEEHGLPSYYADNARRLLGEPMRRWPRCCAGNCEPCSLVLVKVATRVYELLGWSDERAQALARERSAK